MRKLTKAMCSAESLHPLDRLREQSLATPRHAGGEQTPSGVEPLCIPSNLRFRTLMLFARSSRNTCKESANEVSLKINVHSWASPANVGELQYSVSDPKRPLLNPGGLAMTWCAKHKQALTKQYLILPIYLTLPMRIDTNICRIHTAVHLWVNVSSSLWFLATRV